MAEVLRVLVAGADGGIGRATTALLEQRGHAVFPVDRPGSDVTAPSGAEDAVARAVTALGGLDGVVHSIGMSGRALGDGPVSACTDEAWHEVQRVNVESVFRLLRAAVPVLSVRGGSFVTIGSVLGHATDSDFLTAAYATSKAALVGLTRSAAREGAARGLRVNLVLAGLVETPMAARALGSARVGERLRELQPLAEGPVSPRDVAETVLWLLGRQSRATTGAAVPVDGGWSLR